MANVRMNCEGGLSYALVEMLLEAGKYPTDFFGPT